MTGKWLLNASTYIYICHYEHGNLEILTLLQRSCQYISHFPFINFLKLLNPILKALHTPMLYITELHIAIRTILIYCVSGKVNHTSEKSFLKLIWFLQCFDSFFLSHFPQLRLAWSFNLCTFGLFFFCLWMCSLAVFYKSETVFHSVDSCMWAD